MRFLLKVHNPKFHTPLLCVYYRGSLQHFPYADQIRKGKGQGRALGGPPDAQLQKVAPVNVAADKWFKYPGTQEAGQYTLDFNVVLQKAGTNSFRWEGKRDSGAFELPCSESSHCRQEVQSPSDLLGGFCEKTQD